MEDKIIGPLTMLQFVYLLLGGMVVYLTWTLFDFQLFILTGGPVGILTVALAFLKIQDQPFPKFLASTLLFLVKPKSRVWQKDPEASHLTVVRKEPSKPEEKSIPHLKPTRTQLSQLAGVLDTGGHGAAFEDSTSVPEGAPPERNDQIPNDKTQTNSKAPMTNTPTSAAAQSEGQPKPPFETPADKLKKIAEVANGAQPDASSAVSDVTPMQPIPPTNDKGQNPNVK